MDENLKTSLPDTPAGVKERLYNKIPFTKKQMDVVVTVLIIATVAAFIIGALVGNGVISL